jgi:hypothetical protein
MTLIQEAPKRAQEVIYERWEESAYNQVSACVVRLHSVSFVFIQ